jgi:hypothetical protein
LARASRWLGSTRPYAPVLMLVRAPERLRCREWVECALELTPRLEAKLKGGAR